VRSFVFLTKVLIIKKAKTTLEIRLYQTLLPKLRKDLSILVTEPTGWKLPQT